MTENKWDTQFQTHTHTYGKEPNYFIRENSNTFPTGAKIACLAEGEGRNAVHLATLGYDVTAYDLSSVGLKNAQKLAEENGVTIQTVQADLTKELTVDNPYDGAIMVFAHVHKEKQQALFDNLFQIVKPGGHILFEVYSEAQLPYASGGPGKEAFLYDPRDVLTWIASYECLHFYYGEAERYEGYRHTGLSHVIQAKIRK